MLAYFSIKRFNELICVSHVEVLEKTVHIAAARLGLVYVISTVFAKLLVLVLEGLDKLLKLVDSRGVLSMLLFEFLKLLVEASYIV